VRQIATLSLLLLAAGCNYFKGETPVETPQPQVEPPKVSTPEDRFAEAVALIDAGKHTEALPALEKLLGEKPSLPEIWDYVEQEAIAAGSAGSMLDRLSVTDAIGGDALHHHTLRASLALAAGRPQETLDAANALKAEYPGESAAFRALAIQAGAQADTSILVATEPADALALATTLTDPAKRIAALQTASAVPGWRAAVLRAALYASAGDTAAAQTELARVTDTDGPRARLTALQAGVGLMTVRAERAAAEASAAEKAQQIHANAMEAGLVFHAVDDYLSAADTEKALALARTHHERHKDGQGPDGALFAAAHVLAAREAGEVTEAFDVATTTRGFIKDVPAEARTTYTREDVRLSYEVCDIGALYYDAGLLPENEAAATRGLAAFCSGDWPRARGLLDPVGLDPRLGVSVGLAAATAWMGTPNGVTAAKAAVEAADRLDDLAARVETRLAWERQARLAGIPTEGDAALKSLEAFSPHAALGMEIYARRLLRRDATAKAPQPAPSEADVVLAWRGLEGNPPLTGTGIAAWARARSQLKNGNAPAALSELGQAVQSLPAIRQGLWAPVLALSGADGPNLHVDVAEATRLAENGGADVLLALHDWSRYTRSARLAASLGDDLTDGMASDRARALKQAFAAEKAKDLLWLLTDGPWPETAHKAVTDIMAAERGLGGLKAPSSLEQVRQKLSETAVFSVYLDDAGTGQILVVTPLATRVLAVKDARVLRNLVQNYRKALLDGTAFTQRPTSPQAGDRVRAAVMDGAAQELTGIARYLFLVPPDLLIVPWQALPEQAEGRRYLADIRTIASALTLDSLLREKSVPESGYKPDYFGIGWNKEDEVAATDAALPNDEVVKTMEAAGLKNPGEMPSIARLFGQGFSEIHEGDQARKEFFSKGAVKARYVHIAGVPAGVDGGFAWADSSTTLGQIRSGDIKARIVVISEAVDPYHQIARANALLESGAQSVVMAMWNTAPSVRTRFLTAFYDSLNRDRTPARALAEARESVVGDALKSGSAESYEDPSFWGGYLLIGAP